MNSKEYDYLSFENDRNERLLKDVETPHPDISENDHNSLNEENPYAIDLKNEEDKKMQKINEKLPNQKNKNEKSLEEVIRKLATVTIICFLFMIIEIIIGYISNSISIMSDAAHLLSNVLGFVISIVSILVSKKNVKSDKDFRYNKAEKIGALVSVFLIWVLTIWLLYEATLKFNSPSKVKGLSMVIISIVGFIFNIIIGVILNRGSHDKNEENTEDIDLHSENDQKQLNNKENNNVNLSSYVIYIICNAFQNIGNFITGIIIFFIPNLSIADSICTYIFSVIFISITIIILKDCLNVIMEGSPEIFYLDSIEKDLMNIEGVVEIHDLHIWSLNNGKLCLSCNLSSKDPQKTLKKAKKIIKKKYNIEQITIQAEDDKDDNNDYKNDFIS